MCIIEVPGTGTILRGYLVLALACAGLVIAGSLLIRWLSGFLQAVTR